MIRQALLTTRCWAAAGLLTGLAGGLATGSGWGADGGATALPPQAFLIRARQPFAQNAWGRFSGTVQHRGPLGKAKMPISVGMLFGTDFLRAQFLLDGFAVYSIRHSYAEGSSSQVDLRVPSREPEIGLTALGIAPEDVTFSFLHWDFVKELDRDKIRGQPCRVMQLRHPDTEDWADVWFSAEHFFPLKVEVHPPGEGEVARTLEFTDFKRHGDMWYIKSLTLEGPNWKTQVKFGEGEIELTEEKPPPVGLFPRPAAGNAEGE